MNDVGGVLLFVRQLELQASLGVYDHERRDKQPILIDLEIGAAFPSRDELAATVDYKAAVEAIRAIVEGRHFDLVEVLASEAANAVLRLPGAQTVTIEIGKPRAIAAARCAGVRLSITRAYADRMDPEGSIGDGTSST